MKKWLFVIVLALSAMGGLRAQAPDWGVADTLEHYPVGPGIEYSKIYFQGKKMLIWVTTVDLTNPNNKIEQAQSRNQVPDVQRWTVPQFSEQNTWAGHKVCVAFNHDFFSYDMGIGIGLNISEGEVTYTKWGRSVLALDQNKTAAVFYPNLDAKAIAPDATEVQIDCYNGSATGLSGDAVLFNRFNALTLSESGTYILLQPLDKWTVNGENVRCKVLRFSQQPVQTTASDYVLFLRGSKQTAFDGKLAVGDTLQIAQQLVTTRFGTPLTNIMQAFHGYPSIAFEGKLHDGEYNDFESGREYEISSRVMAGHSQDGKTLYIVTTEMSTTSAGVNCIDLANYMLSIGCWNVVNFDSGGSAAIVVNHEMLNYPARGSIRPVVDALLAVSVAPETNDITQYRFSKPTLLPTVASLTPLHLLGFNAYDEVLDWNAEGFTFSCEPESLGTVSEQAVFRAGVNAVAGKIIAEKNGIRAEMQVCLQPASNIHFPYSHLYIDQVRRAPVAIKCAVGATEYDMEPSSFAWQIADSAVCSIESGVLVGLKNGTTYAIGTLGDFVDTLYVTVQQADTEWLIWDDFAQPETRWNLQASSASWSTVFSPEAEGGTSLCFTYSATRAPNIKLMLDSTFYGLPDTVSLLLNARNTLLSKILWRLRTGDGQIVSWTQESIPQQELFRLSIPTDSIGGIEIFPLSTESITLYLNASEMQANTDYTCHLQAIQLHYPVPEKTALTDVRSDKVMRIYPNPATDYVQVVSPEISDDCQLSLYSLQGVKICTQAGKQLNVSHLPAGNYILRAATANGMWSAPLIIR